MADDEFRDGQLEKEIDPSMSTYGTSWIGYVLVRELGWGWIPRKEPHPIEMILSEIERAIRFEFYYLAIALSLTLPDICCALRSPIAKTDDRLYRKWVKKYLRRLPGLAPLDCWSLRCGVVHE